MVVEGSEGWLGGREWDKHDRLRRWALLVISVDSNDRLADVFIFSQQLWSEEEDLGTARG